MMAQILVHMDAGPGAGRRLALARRLASEHRCAVMALYAATPAMVELPVVAGTTIALVEALKAADDHQLGQARAQYEAQMRYGGPAVEWGVLMDYPLVPAFAEIALCADLLVLGQPDPDARLGEIPRGFNEGVLVASGRPAIVVPHAGSVPERLDTVAIAWKPTREAARAVTAAMPLLRQARQVHVLHWSDEAGLPPRALDLDAYLRQHGVLPHWQRNGPEPERIGDALLSRVADLGADLLVMGCYGHSRAREWVLGGATRTLLRSMTLPVLMAH